MKHNRYKQETQLQFQLTTFEYENQLPIRTVMINGEPWFYGVDICRALDLTNPSEVYKRLEEDDLSTTEVIDTLGRKQNARIISQYGLYDLVLESRKEGARKFKRWITHEVIPRIQKTGSYSLLTKVTPLFVQRACENMNRTDEGYFSVIGELFFRVYGKFEAAGYILADRASDGKEMRMENSVGGTFSSWLKVHYPTLSDSFKMYRHRLPNGNEIDARQYRNEVFPAFMEFINNVWLLEYAYNYFKKRDPIALQYLPRLLPPPSR